MKIAQIAPLVESVPPTLYGGTERVVSYLTEELVRQGHDVTLFATGDSQTSARLISVVPRALRLDTAVKDVLPYNIVMLGRVAKHAQEFDILHFHIDLLHFPLFHSMRNRVLTTLHGRLDLPDLHPFYRAFSDMPLVSISNHQRTPMPPVQWMATIHHGLPLDFYKLQTREGGYLAFLGRISPEKGPDRAIDIAQRAGIPLKIAAKVDKVDIAYFEARIRPLLDHPLIDYVGELGEHEKDAFLGNARALLFPIDWPEPFGLAMIESMGCGTPVIAFDRGSVSEVLEQGVTGFIVNTTDEAVAAVGMLDRLSRVHIRKRFEERFSVTRMAQQYVGVYRRMVSHDERSSRAA